MDVAPLSTLLEDLGGGGASCTGILVQVGRLVLVEARRAVTFSYHPSSCCKAREVLLPGDWAVKVCGLPDERARYSCLLSERREALAGLGTAQSSSHSSRRRSLNRLLKYERFENPGIEIKGLCPRFSGTGRAFQQTVNAKCKAGANPVNTQWRRRRASLYSLTNLIAIRGDERRAQARGRDECAGAGATSN